MASFTAQIGTFDLSDYVRVSPGEGLDPYAKGWEEPAWSDSPFGEGQPLSNVDARNREMVFPLYLNKPSKDELHGLVRDLNRAIRYPTGQLQLTWQDEDATDPTYYDVEHARLDPEFSFRQSAQGWLAGVLRVWCAPPYGHTGTYRVVGTSAAGPIASFAVPSMAGDVDAEPLIYINASRAAVPAPAADQQTWNIVARLPTPSWVAWLGATSGTADAQAIGSIMKQAAVGPGLTTFDLGLFVPEFAEVYKGHRTRLLALMSSDNSAATRVMSAQIAVYGDYDSGISQPINLPTTICQAASGAWDVVDLGVFEIDEAAVESALGGTELTIGLSYPSAAATVVTALNGYFVLPEDDTFVGLDHIGVASHAALASTTIGAATAVSRYTPVSNNPVGRALDAHGVVPRLPVVGSSRLFVAQVREGNTRNNYPLDVEVRVRERFTFAR